VKSAALLFAMAASACAQPWTPLFEGRSLDAWETSGKARWTVENGILVGRQGEDGSPGDLFSRDRFTNFEVQAEWSMKWPANSGFWFKYQGPGTGCQADFLDQQDQPATYSGSVYCIGPKFVASNRDPKTVRKDGWNSLRMIVQGSTVRVWMNGTLVSEGIVSVFPGPGKVGLQVHPGKDFEGMEIRLRSARIRRLP
jgi:hypothetical protein